MPHLSPQTLTQAEQRAILLATTKNPRDHLIYSLALGTGLRLAEIVGLDVGDVYTPEGKPKNRVRLRPEIAKNGRAGDVFLPDALLVKFRKFWRHKATSDRLYPFHSLRHTAVTNVYRASRDLFLAQRFARHVSPLTTTIYTHPSDQELWTNVRRLTC
jgi:integrase/recombinase XerC